jgi:hypothetical protein
VDPGRGRGAAAGLAVDVAHRRERGDVGQGDADSRDAGASAVETMACAASGVRKVLCQPAR